MSKPPSDEGPQEPHGFMDGWEPPEPPPSMQQIAALAAAEARTHPPTEGATAKVLPMFRREVRAQHSGSFLTLVQILSTPEMRGRFMGDKSIELNELGEDIEIGRVPIRDVDVSVIRAGLEQCFVGNRDKGTGMKFGDRDVRSAIALVAAEHPYHPVQAYLRGLKWDGVHRLDHVAHELLGIEEPKPLVPVLLRKWFLTAVARAIRPGELVKTMLVLVGSQNARKSSFFRELASPRWFADAPLDIKNKESHILLASVWIYEWAELRGLHGRHADDLKAWLSSPVGDYVPKFSNYRVKRARTSVTAGTTNNVRFLTDPTGNVRFHPVVVGERINLERTREWRDQLWAEAMVAHAAGEPHYLTPEQDAELALLQADHIVLDPWTEKVRAWIKGQEKEAAGRFDSNNKRRGWLNSEPLASGRILEHAIPKHPSTWKDGVDGDLNRIGSVMKGLGFERIRATVPEGWSDDPDERPHAWAKSKSRDP